MNPTRQTKCLFAASACTWNGTNSECDFWQFCCVASFEARPFWRTQLFFVNFNYKLLTLAGLDCERFQEYSHSVLQFVWFLGEFAVALSVELYVDNDDPRISPRPSKRPETSLLYSRDSLKRASSYRSSRFGRFSWPGVERKGEQSESVMYLTLTFQWPDKLDASFYPAIQGKPKFSILYSLSPAILELYIGSRSDKRIKAMFVF